MLFNCFKSPDVSGVDYLCSGDHVMSRASRCAERDCFSAGRQSSASLMKQAHEDDDYRDRREE